MNLRQGTQIDKSSVIVLILDKDDIKSKLRCNSKRVNEIFGMAKDGKFTDIIMDNFWETIDACNNISEYESEQTKKYYYDLGKKKFINPFDTKIKILNLLNEEYEKQTSSKHGSIRAIMISELIEKITNEVEN